MEIRSHESFAAAWHEGLADLVRTGEQVPGVRDAFSVGSGFGRQPRATLELRPYSFAVQDPRACLVLSSTRQPSLPYAVGQWLWAMRGADDLPGISLYNGRGQSFSDDGRRLNAALGARMRKPIDQLAGVLDLLQRDASTRRAQVVLARPTDVLAQSRDISCPAVAQVFLRQGRLEMGVTMRSQSAFGVLPYDVALFMMVHCWLAAMLDVPVGRHVWLAWSFHVYAEELPLVRDLVESRSPDPVEFPSFHDPLAGLAKVLGLEADVAQAVERGDPDAVRNRATELEPNPSAEVALAAVVIANAASRLDDDLSREAATAALPSTWQRMMRIRHEAGR